MNQSNSFLIVDSIEDILLLWTHVEDCGGPIVVRSLRLFSLAQWWSTGSSSQVPWVDSWWLLAFHLPLFVPHDMSLCTCLNSPNSLTWRWNWCGIYDYIITEFAGDHGTWSTAWYLGSYLHQPACLALRWEGRDQRVSLLCEHDGCVTLPTSSCVEWSSSRPHLLCYCMAGNFQGGKL